MQQPDQPHTANTGMAQQHPLNGSSSQNFHPSFTDGYSLRAGPSNSNGTMLQASQIQLAPIKTSTEPGPCSYLHLGDSPSACAGGEHCRFQQGIESVRLLKREVQQSSDAGTSTGYACALTTNGGSHVNTGSWDGSRGLENSIRIGNGQNIPGSNPGSGAGSVVGGPTGSSFKAVGFGGMRAATGLSINTGVDSCPAGADWAGRHAAWLRDENHRPGVQMTGREVMVNHSEAWNGDVRYRAGNMGSIN